MRSSSSGLAESGKDSTVMVRVEIPRELYDTYEEIATKSGREVEEEIAIRLQRCRDHTASQCLYFNDAQRQEFGIITGRSVATPEQALNACRNAMRVQCGTIKFQLSARHSQRLASRATIERRTPAQVAEREMLRGLEEHLGMR